MKTSNLVTFSHLNYSLFSPNSVINAQLSADEKFYNSVGILPVSLYFCLYKSLSSSLSGRRGYFPALFRAQ